MSGGGKRLQHRPHVRQQPRVAGLHSSERKKSEKRRQYHPDEETRALLGLQDTGTRHRRNTLNATLLRVLPRRLTRSHSKLFRSMYTYPQRDNGRWVHYPKHSKELIQHTHSMALLVLLLSVALDRIGPLFGRYTRVGPRLNSALSWTFF